METDSRLFAKCPEVYEYIWLWFEELHRFERTQDGVSGVYNPLSSLQIRAWSQMNGIKLSPKEFKLLRLLDKTLLGVMNGR